MSQRTLNEIIEEHGDKVLAKEFYEIVSKNGYDISTVLDLYLDILLAKGSTEGYDFDEEYRHRSTPLYKLLHNYE